MCLSTKHDFFFKYIINCDSYVLFTRAVRVSVNCVQAVVQEKAFVGIELTSGAKCVVILHQDRNFLTEIMGLAPFYSNIFNYIYLNCVHGRVCVPHELSIIF